VRWYWILVLVLGVPLYLGIINLGGTHVNKAGSAAVPENTACPGYKLIRQFKTDGTISSFKPVKPASGWDCEYVVNDGVGDVRFRTVGNNVGLAFVAGGSTHTLDANNLDMALQSEAQKLGFTGG
jgi:hypothetical protein